MTKPIDYKTRLRSGGGGTQERKCVGPCKMMRGVNAYKRGDRICHLCRRAEREGRPMTAAGPSLEQIEADRRPLEFSRSVREAAGVPVKSEGRPGCSPGDLPSSGR